MRLTPVLSFPSFLSLPSAFGGRHTRLARILVHAHSRINLRVLTSSVLSVTCHRRGHSLLYVGA